MTEAERVAASLTELVTVVAEALANAIAMRKGSPPIRNCLAMMPSEMAERFRDDARAAIPLALEYAAKIAENPGFIEARDTEWDEGVNYAKRYISTAILRTKESDND